MKILAPISLGELIDKITILEIKYAAVQDPEKRHNIRVELDELNRTLFELELTDKDYRLLENFHLELKGVNEIIWELEDLVRACIDRDDKSDIFIQVARDIPETNDRRALVKKQINERFGSLIIEEKLYGDADE